MSNIIASTECSRDMIVALNDADLHLVSGAFFTMGLVRNGIAEALCDAGLIKGISIDVRDHTYGRSCPG